jgi:hypothetical protein
MMGYRLDYVIMAAEERVRPTRDQARAQNRGVKRIYHIGLNKPAARDAGRR